MQAIEIKPGVYWVGGIDWDLRYFHGYVTPRGSTYNSYLIIDDKITLVDTVKHYLADEMLSRSNLLWIRSRSITWWATMWKWITQEASPS